MTTPLAPPSREAEIAAWLDGLTRHVMAEINANYPGEPLSEVPGLLAFGPIRSGLDEAIHMAHEALLAQLQQARQERDERQELALSFERSLTKAEAALQQAREALTVAHARLTEWMGNEDGYAIELVCEVAEGLDAALKAVR